MIKRLPSHYVGPEPNSVTKFWCPEIMVSNQDKYLNWARLPKCHFDMKEDEHLSGYKTRIRILFLQFFKLLLEPTNDYG